MDSERSLIRKVADQAAKTGIAGHPDVTAYDLIQGGEKGSLHLSIRLNVIEPGGSINPHYHTDCDPFDHAFYIISGELLISLAGREHRVGADTLLYYRSDEVHAIINIGSEKAKILAISGFAPGGSRGRTIYLG